MSVCPVVFLNGPPRSGKDTLAGHIVRTFPEFKAIKFAEILKNATHHYHGITARTHDAFEDVKDIPNDLFGGLTPRQAYIHLSEKVLKPIKGPTVFGDMLLETMINDPAKGFVISDSGFHDEAMPLIAHYGRHNCILVRIHADDRGCTFQNDSRSYLDLPIETIDLFNNAGEVSFLYESKLKLDPILQSMIGGF